jgi:ketopantoate reductase
MRHNSPIVIIGLGQLGSLFSTGFLRLGYPVFPVLRDDQPIAAAESIHPITVVAAVGETDLPNLLSSLPEAWKDRITLISNELLPATWRTHAIHNPTIISVQFEKKHGQPVVIDHPSPVFGPQADLLIDALRTLSIPTIKIEELEAMTHHLVLKNLYILTLNLGGLTAQTKAGELLSQHRGITEKIWAELFSIQQAMVETSLDPAILKQQTLDYLALAPERGAGRSAAARLERAIEHARRLGIQVPTLNKIKQEIVK